MLSLSSHARFVFVVLALTLAACAKPGGDTANLPTNVNANLNRPSSNENRAPTDKTVEKIPALQTEADRLLKLFDDMPAVPVFVKDAPVLKKGTNVETSVAYTDCQNKTNPTIYVKRVFYAKANQKQLTNILKHEMTHAWFCRQGVAASHDARFRRKFKEVGGFGN